VEAALTPNEGGEVSYNSNGSHGIFYH